jgi:hypothetical protein
MLYVSPEPSFRVPRKGADPLAWLLLVAFVTGLLLAGASALLAVASHDPAPSPSPASSAPASSTSVQRMQIGDGAYRVGPDIPAGRWRSADPLTPRTCRWWTTLPGQTMIIVRPDSEITDRVPAVVRLDPGTDFHSLGCGEWRRA